MTEHNSNPFVLPGMGQGSADMAGNPLLASMEMMRKAWAGLTGPGGLAQALPMATPMNLEDLDRRIAELRTVEGWLRMNLTMLSSTIQGMEVQRSTIATLRSFVDSMGAQAADPSAWAGASPLEVALGLKRPGQERAQASPSDAPPPDRKAEAPPEPEPEMPADRGPAQDSPAGSGYAGVPPLGALPPGADPLASAQAMGNATQSASQAWWGLLQQQFNQIAAATAASMPQGGPGMPAGAADEGGAAAPAAPGTEAKSAAPAAKAAAGSASGTASKTASKAAAKPRKPASRKIDPDMDA